MSTPGRTWILGVRRGLLAFYDARRRDLPWRRDPDPYRVWVSEVMLQQTRVDAVVPYYERWLRRFPTLHALATAEPDEVLRAWEGLGYYARARNLHRAARVVRERHAGDVPSEPAALRELPGVGDYTAGAIASIAFGRREPAVDGNVRRVLARLLDVADPPPARLRAVAAALVPAERPGDFNQALMELGATVCTPRNPSCDACPAAMLCRARARGTQHLRPRARRKAEVPAHHFVVVVLVAPSGEMLVVRRPEAGLLGGMWVFPAEETGEGAEVGSHGGAEALSQRLIGESAEAVALGVVPHAFSHRREVYHAYLARVGRTADIEGGRWVSADGLAALAMPVAQRRIASAASACMNADGLRGVLRRPRR